MKTDTGSAFEQGAKAYRKDKPITSNPYSLYPFRRAWENGYNGAERSAFLEVVEPADNHTHDS